MRIVGAARRIGIGVALVILGGATGHAEFSVTDIVDAARRGDIHAVHRIIESSPESVSATDDTGYTALHWAGIRGHWRIFTELIAAGAPVNAVGGDGGTPLQWACHHDRADMVGLLIDAGSEIDVHNRWGRTPLHVAARRGCPAVAELLLERGADPNAVTLEGWTPLHVALMSDHERVVAILIAGGADPAVEDGSGKTAKELARTRPAPVEIDPVLLDDYVGIYDLGGGFTAKVWRDDDTLRIRDFAPDDLVPIAVDNFFCIQEPWRVEFERGDDGDVETVVLHFLRRSVQGAKTPSPQYIGSKACLSCHTAHEEGNSGLIWLQSGHSHAYWRLAADWALYLGRLRPQYADLESPIADDRCLLCHVAGRQEDDALFAATYREEEGVSCEACHGPGSLYMDPEIMADREAFLANGGRIPDESTCRGCHRRSEEFDFAEFSEKIRHWEVKSEG